MYVIKQQFLFDEDNQMNETEARAEYKKHRQLIENPEGVPRL